MKRSHALPWQPARDPEPGPGGRPPPIAHKARSDVMIWLGVSKFTHFAATHLTLHWDTPDCFLLLMLELKQTFYFSLFFYIAKKAKAGKEPTGKTVTLLLKDDLTGSWKKKNLRFNVVSSSPPQRRFRRTSQTSPSPNAEPTSSSVS